MTVILPASYHEYNRIQIFFLGDRCSVSVAPIIYMPIITTLLELVLKANGKANISRPP